MNVKEARAEFILTMEDACIESCEHDSKDGWEHNITIAADAYALQAHVDACERVGIASTADKNRTFPYVVCGDGWYCDKAKRIEELGR